MTTPATDAPFSSVGIVGLGLIGASVALATRRAWPGIRVVACDRVEALDDGARVLADRLSGDLADVITADLVVFALPVTSILSTFGVLPAPPGGTVLTDVGSTKRDIMAGALRHHVPRFIGGHPMAGSERGGRDYARADLFDGRPWLLVHGSAGAGDEQRLERFVAGLGAVPLWLDATTHDRVIAYVSHVPQVLAVALMDAAVEGIGIGGLKASGRAFAEMTRLASSPAELWEDILATNADFIGDALDEVVRRFPTSADLNGRTWVRDIFTRAAAARRGQGGGPASNE